MEIEIGDSWLEKLSSLIILIGVVLIGLSLIYTPEQGLEDASVFMPMILGIQCVMFSIQMNMYRRIIKLEGGDKDDRNNDQ